MPDTTDRGFTEKMAGVVRRVDIKGVIRVQAAAASSGSWHAPDSVLGSVP